MKRYIKEIVVLLVQLFMFYVYPLFTGPTDAIAMVIIILFTTFLLSAALGGISGERIKYLYPAAAAVLFLPSVFIYYNESALVHSLWYLVISSVGLAIGAVVRAIVRRLVIRK